MFKTFKLMFRTFELMFQSYKHNISERIVILHVAAQFPARQTAGLHV